MAVSWKEKSKGRNATPTSPTGPNPNATGSSSLSGSVGSSSSGPGAGAKGKDSTSTPESGISAAQRKADKKEAEYRKKAGQRYTSQAQNLEAQAKALQFALNNSYKGALKQKLQNVGRTLRQQDSILLTGYRDRVSSLEGALSDNEKASANQDNLNQINLSRERTAAVAEAALQGAGESDLLQAQMMSLRNWQQNQSEVQRSLFDTTRSINSALTDLNTDTKTGRANLAIQANSDREQLWTQYYNQRSESFTQLGNIRGQQADYLDSAKEYGVGKGGNTKSGEKAFMDASRAAGKAWKNPGVPKRLMKWDGRGEFETQGRNPDAFRGAPSVDLGKAPEGASLRKWG